MKTLVLATVSAAALMVASASFAQAMDPTAPVSQIGSGGMNIANQSSDIDQVGDGNHATVSQTARHDSSVVLQNSPSPGAPMGSGGTIADVSQNGDGARALVVQMANTTRQSGGAETTDITQNGVRNAAFASQSGEGDSASIYQNETDSSHGNAHSNLFDVNGRSSQQGATDDKNYAEGLTGASQEAWAAQGSDSYGATIVQDKGGYNQGVINQESSRGDNAALIVTTNSTFDHAYINQVNGTSKSKAAIRQDSDAYKTATINQNGATNGSATIEQASDGFATSTAGIDQFGNRQTAHITQKGNSAAQAYTFQSASANNAYSRTTQTGSYLGGDATANTYQYAMNDYSIINQNDVGSLANVTQQGANDASLISQGVDGNGGSNNANVYQTAAKAWSNVSQTGNFNTASVSQTGGMPPAR